MGYYVISQDGRRYGPADVVTLQQWVRERRIAPNTTLEDEFSGAQIQARLLPELRGMFPDAPTVQGDLSYQQRRPPLVGGGASSRATTALVLGILGVICCQFIGIPAIILGKAEMNDIDAGLAPVEGRGLAQAGYILGIVALVMLALLLLWFVVIMDSVRGI